MIVKVLEGKGGTDGVWGAVLIIRGWGRGGWRQPECPHIHTRVVRVYQDATKYTLECT